MDPLWDFRKEDAVDLIHDWCDGVGLIFPVVGRSKLLEIASDVFDALESAQREGLKSKEGLVAEALFTDETSQLKMVLAIGRTLQSGGRNNQAQRLFESITEVIEGLFWNPTGIRGIQLLVLVVR